MDQGHEILWKPPNGFSLIQWGLLLKKDVTVTYENYEIHLEDRLQRLVDTDECPNEMIMDYTEYWEQYRGGICPIMLGPDRARWAQEFLEQLELPGLIRITSVMREGMTGSYTEDSSEIESFKLDDNWLEWLAGSAE
jgi:hypothetical protein